jgi:putative RNA 2'-phosphotransferase
MYSKNEKKEASKTISYILRHGPGDIGLKLDSNGWCDIDELIEKLNKWSNTSIMFSQELVEIVVLESDKQRFSIKNGKIRANQGHTTNVDLEFLIKEPPHVLYHGSAVQNVDSILKEGLKPMDRHYVHLSFSAETATSVGSRYGKPVIFSINAKKMHDDGFVFKVSDNDVWLIKEVPAQYIEQNLFPTPVKKNINDV